VNSVRFSPTGDRIAIAADDPSVFMYEIETPNVVTKFPGHEEEV